MTFGISWSSTFFRSAALICALLALGARLGDRRASAGSCRHGRRGTAAWFFSLGRLLTPTVRLPLHGRPARSIAWRACQWSRTAHCRQPSLGAAACAARGTDSHRVCARWNGSGIRPIRIASQKAPKSRALSRGPTRLREFAAFALVSGPKPVARRRRSVRSPSGGISMMKRILAASAALAMSADPGAGAGGQGRREPALHRHRRRARRSRSTAAWSSISSSMPTR